MTGTHRTQDTSVPESVSERFSERERVSEREPLPRYNHRVVSHVQRSWRIWREVFWWPGAAP
jgi:hypothetical protein